MSHPAPEAFWDFSLRTYGCSGVPQACLALQDEYGADVNLVLYCCWAGARAGALDAAGFDAAGAFSREWAAQVVHPLRAVRRWMKNDGCDNGPVDTPACLALREQVKAVELAAEQLQQLTLASLPLPAAPAAGPSGAGLAAVAANLRRYCRGAGIPLNATVIARLVVIVDAALAPASEDELRYFAAQLTAADA